MKKVSLVINNEALNICIIYGFFIRFVKGYIATILVKIKMKILNISLFVSICPLQRY